MMTKNQYRYPKIKCNTCKDIIQSRYSGEVVACKCYIASSIVQEKMLEKIQKYLGDDFLGEWVSFKADRRWFMENDIRHFIRCELNQRHGTGITIDSTPWYDIISGAINNYTVIDSGDSTQV